MYKRLTWGEVVWWLRIFGIKITQKRTVLVSQPPMMNFRSDCSTTIAMIKYGFITIFIGYGYEEWIARLHNGCRVPWSSGILRLLCEFVIFTVVLVAVDPTNPWDEERSMPQPNSGSVKHEKKRIQAMD